jgi:hypothetical protein
VSPRDGTNLLIDEPPLVVLPSLAKAIGLNPALLLQQLHFRGRQEPHGWVQRSLPGWREDGFAFWSEDTIKRALAELRRRRLVDVEQSASTDRSNRYRVNYDAVRRLLPSVQLARMDLAGTDAEGTVASAQIAPMSIGKERTTEGKRGNPAQSSNVTRLPGNEHPASRAIRELDALIPDEAAP